VRRGGGREEKKGERGKGFRSIKLHSLERREGKRREVPCVEVGKRKKGVLRAVVSSTSSDEEGGEGERKGKREKGRPIPHERGRKKEKKKVKRPIISPRKGRRKKGERGGLLFP